MNFAMTVRKVFRDAITGQFTSKSKVKENPDTTVTETVPSPPAYGLRQVTNDLYALQNQVILLRRAATEFSDRIVDIQTNLLTIQNLLSKNNK